MKFLKYFWAICGVLAVLLTSARIAKCDSVEVVRLDKKWTLTNGNETIRIANLALPSGVYSALSKEDVLFSYNDVNTRWIAYDNWTYSVNFSYELRNVTFVNLTLHGVDTVAEVKLNHNLLGRTDNMFIRYSYDVTKMLQAENTLEISIKSPIYAAAAAAAALAAKDHIVPPECPDARYNGECHMNMLRKMQASFAWDWGLAAPSMGLWKSVDLEFYEVALIRDIDIVATRNASHWNMQVRVFIDAGARRDFYAVLTVYAVEILDDPIVVDVHKTLPISHKAPIIEFERSIPVDNVTLWWPNGYGYQKLYPLHFTLNAWLDEGGPRLRSKTISTKDVRFGFRTIELVEERTPEGTGNTFLFKVNGVEVFMKGTNYIPSHILPEHSNDHSRIKHLLLSAKEAHMNMIRVWGGGIYESDYFYDLADQYGLLIWQDMMFACAMYPVTDSFLASVRVETVQNAKRIAHHPSIAIFATNNENEAALVQNWYGTIAKDKLYRAEYRELYLATVLHELKIIEHSSRPLPLVSSPSNGKESEKDQYISANPQDPNFGDVHYYNYFADGWDPAIYPCPRFASEYGFQSLPAMQAWNGSKAEGDDLIGLMNHRQHHPLGMLPITVLIHQHLPLPLPEDENYAEALIYFSQIAQAQATKVETEFYRRMRDTECRTMGALYWQLNDVWVAPSWSSIDFNGNFKLLQYWAKEFMAPIAIVALYDSGNKAVNISLVCDQLQVNTTDLTVTQNIYSWSKLFPRKTTFWPVTLKANGVQYDKVIPTDAIFTDSLTSENSFVEFTLERQSDVLSRTYFFPTSIRRAQGIVDPKLSVKISWTYCGLSGMNSYSLTITVERPAVFVYIEVRHPAVRQYELSRNGFMQMTPVQVVNLEFASDPCIVLSSSHIQVLTVNQFMV